MNLRLKFLKIHFLNGVPGISGVPVAETVVAQEPEQGIESAFPATAPWVIKILSVLGMIWSQKTVLGYLVLCLIALMDLNIVLGK